MKLSPRTDVSGLPTYGDSHRMPLWWGTLGFIVIEGLSFVFSIAAYFYLQSQNRHWPLNPPPYLLWSSLILLLFLASELPNQWTKKAAAAHDLRKVRIGLLIMSAVAIAILGLRAMEFTTLGVRWNDNAYGSIVWFLLGLHTTHLLTDAAETFVMTVLVHVGPIDMRRFSEVEDNQNYWDFVVISWLPIYATLYWVPRWLGSVP